MVKEVGPVKRIDVPKRPKKLPAEAWISNIKGVPYYVVVGLLNDIPYEIFTGLNSYKNEDGIVIPNIAKYDSEGFITKKSRGGYSYVSYGIIYDLSDGSNGEQTDALCRMISTSLRDGSGIKDVIQQLEKTKGELASIAKLLARTLKKYTKGGTRIRRNIKECPACNSREVEKGDGCVICLTCGWMWG